jgi:hypothetical protein
MGQVLPEHRAGQAAEIALVFGVATTVVALGLSYRL